MEINKLFLHQRPLPRDENDWVKSKLSAQWGKISYFRTSVPSYTISQLTFLPASWSRCCLVNSSLCRQDRHLPLQLWEEFASHKALFGAKKDDIGPKNTFLGTLIMNNQ